MEHDAQECEDCSFQEVVANKHIMQVVLPCDESAAYWACVTCDQLERWPVIGDIKATNEIFNAMLYVHCIDNLVYS